MAFQILGGMKEILEIIFWMMRPGFPRMEQQLYHACKDGQRDVLLWMSTPKLMKATPERDMPLHICAKTGRLDCVQLLLQIYGQNFVLHRMLMLHYYTNSIGNTALHEAAKEGHATVVEELVRRYQRLASRVNKYGETPLFLSCENGHLSCVQSLLRYDNGSSALTFTRDGRPPLHVAAFMGYLDIVNVIADCVEGKKAIRMKDGRGVTTLHWAIEGEQVAVAKNLIEREPNLCYLKDGFGRCPIHIAAMKGHVELINSIASARSDCIDMRSKDGKTILHYAVENNRVSVVEWICNDQTYHKFQGNERDHMGNEPLHVAVISSSNDTIIQMLLNAFPCANRSNMNNQGLAPVQLCHKGEVSELIKERLKTTFTHEKSVRVMKGNSESNESDGVIEMSSVIAGLIASTAATMQFSTDETVHDRESQIYLFYDLYISIAFFASMLVLLVWLVMDPLTKQGMPHRPWLKITMPILGVAEVSLSAAFFIKKCLGASKILTDYQGLQYKFMAFIGGVIVYLVLWILYSICRNYLEMSRKETFKSTVFFLLVRLPIIMLLGIGLPFLWMYEISFDWYDISVFRAALQAAILISILPLIHRFGHIKAFLILAPLAYLGGSIEAVVVIIVVFTLGYLFS